MPGYDILPLQDGATIQERLKCCHCRLVMSDPVQTKQTGLLYCRECFSEVVKYVYNMLCVCEYVVGIQYVHHVTMDTLVNVLLIR